MKSNIRKMGLLLLTGVMIVSLNACETESGLSSNVVSNNASSRDVSSILNNESSAISNQGESSFQSSLLSADELDVKDGKNIVSKLIEDYYKLYKIKYHLMDYDEFNSKTFPEASGSGVFYAVVDPDIKSISDIKIAIEKVYTKDYAEQYIYSGEFNQNKNWGYKEADGILYSTINEGVGDYATLEIDSLKIISQSQNEVIFEMNNIGPDGSVDGKDTMIVSYENEQWRIKGGSYFDRINNMVN